MKKMIFALLLLAATSAHANDTQIYIAPEKSSCGDWLEMAAAPNKDVKYYAAKWFVIGVYGGIMAQANVNGTLREGSSAVAFISYFCTNHPLSNLMAASHALAEASGGPKTQFPWKR